MELYAIIGVFLLWMRIEYLRKQHEKEIQSYIEENNRLKTEIEHLKNRQ